MRISNKRNSLAGRIGLAILSTGFAALLIAVAKR
jgi:hypothetical protein